MGFLKTWKVSGLTREGAILSEPIHRLGQYINQNNEEISSSMRADLIAVGKQYIYMYDFLDSYINKGITKHHDEATKFLVMFAAYGYGSDGNPWDWALIRHLSQGLWGSMEDTPDEFELYNVPLIKTSINQINNFMMNISHGSKASDGPTNDTWGERVSTLLEMNDWQGLLDWCQKWTKSEPKNVGALIGLGTAYGKLNRHNDAIGAYQEVLRINPDNDYAWFDLGNIYSILNRYTDAIEANRQALRINPEYDGAWYNLGNNYSRINRYDEAIEAYRHALRINSEDASAWETLGLTYAFSGNRTAALEVVKELRRLDPARAEELFNRIVPLVQKLKKRHLEVVIGNGEDMVTKLISVLARRVIENKYDLTVRSFWFGEELLEQAENGAVDIFILILPNIRFRPNYPPQERVQNSVQLITQIKTIYHVPVIALSSLGELDTRSKLAGSDFFLPLPFEHNVFKEAIEKCLDMLPNIDEVSGKRLKEIAGHNIT